MKKIVLYITAVVLGVSLLLINVAETIYLHKEPAVMAGKAKNSEVLQMSPDKHGQQRGLEKHKQNTMRRYEQALTFLVLVSSLLCVRAYKRTLSEVPSSKAGYLDSKSNTT